MTMTSDQRLEVRVARDVSIDLGTANTLVEMSGGSHGA